MDNNALVKELAESGASVDDLLRNRAEATDGDSWKSATEWLWAQGTNGVGNVLFRSDAGFFVFLRSATQNETYYFFMSAYDQLRRTSDAKGLKVLTFSVNYRVISVDAVTVDLHPVFLTFQGGSSPTLTPILFTYDSDHDTNAKRIAHSGALSGEHLVTATITNPGYSQTPASYLGIELDVTIPNGCTFVFYGGGYTAAHNYL